MSSLIAAIESIDLFGQKVNVIVPSGHPPIAQYLGQPLAITGITVPAATDADQTLVFQIDDQNAPVPLPPLNSIPALPAKAKIKVLGIDKYYETAATSDPLFTYSGGPVTMTGRITLDASLNKEVIPVLSPWQSPQNGDLDFVIVRVSDADLELRWLEGSVPFATAPTSASVVPPAPAPGVVGPFGLETP